MSLGHVPSHAVLLLSAFVSVCRPHTSPNLTHIWLLCCSADSDYFLLLLSLRLDTSYVALKGPAIHCTATSNKSALRGLIGGGAIVSTCEVIKNTHISC